MKAPRSMALLIGLAVTSTLFVAAPAQAARKFTATDAQVLEVARRTAESGTMTSADRALVLSRPDMAGLIVDPTLTTITSLGVLTHRATASELPTAKTTFTPGSVAASTTGTTSATAAYCSSASGYITHYSTLGFVVLRLWQQLNWCYQSGGYVYSANHSYWNTNVDWVFKFSGMMIDRIDNIGGYQITSIVQQHWEYCVIKYGCYGQYYPRINIQADASAHYRVW